MVSVSENTCKNGFGWYRWGYRWEWCVNCRKHPQTIYIYICLVLSKRKRTEVGVYSLVCSRCCRKKHPTLLQIIIVGTCWNLGVSVLGRPLSVVKVSWRQAKFKAALYCWHFQMLRILSDTHVYACIPHVPAHPHPPSDQFHPIHSSTHPHAHSASILGRRHQTPHPKACKGQTWNGNPKCIHESSESSWIIQTAQATSKLLVRNMFNGLRSRWMMGCDRPWRYTSASQVFKAQRIAKLKCGLKTPSTEEVLCLSM